MQVLNEFIENLYVGEAVEFDRLKVAPIFVREERGLPYLELEEALKSGLVEVTEVSEQGSVPELRVLNKSLDRDVIILDGEELVGAKQNRIVNLTTVIPAGATVGIPVSCVEQSRWGYSSPSFSTSQNVSYSSLRTLKHRSVTQSLRSTGTSRSDQGGIWGDIRAKMSRMEVASPTMAMSDMYTSRVDGESNAGAVEELKAKMSHREGQVGYLAFVGGGFAGGDVFGSSGLCRTKLNKLVRSHYLESLDRGVEFPALTVEQIIKQVVTAEQEQFATVGKGAELRFESQNVQGAWKLVDNFIPHLMVFPKLN